ncbi:putative MFS family arabinose efflux permease [Antricoccus suffuscus]|uniref:Putative MFS family arabinose efflux permease n=1 Tax=Antricoccus suffuscus TaxID=1629062 RepID=A0A2T1A3F5_9ACTN|nr:MFS transporter [Antricoccus suffuscus]PRZ42838.1 putative MFS family arabinose efflux permease [Antricoccus suffuscus]
MRIKNDVPRDVLTMAGVALCVSLGFGIVAPAIPLFATQFGVSATAAGVVVSSFALMRLIFGLVAGRLADRLGGRTSLIIGLAVVAVSSLLAGVAQDYPQLLILRGIGGMGSALFGVASMAIVLNAAGKQLRGQAMSIYRMGFLVGGIIGPAAGGAVLGISLRAPFFLYGGTLALAGVVGLVFLGRDAEKATPSDSDEGDAVPETPAPDRTFGEVLRTREYQAALTTNFAVGLAVFGIRSTVLPLLIVEHLHASPGWVGVAFLVSALVQTALMFPAGKWSDTAGRRPPLVVGSAIAGAGLLMLAFAGSLAMALIAIGLFSAGSAFLGTVPGALVGDVAGKRSGTVLAVFNMASDFGAVIGPVVAGWLVDQGSYTAAFGLGAGVVLLSGVLGMRLRPREASTIR